MATLTKEEQQALVNEGAVELWTLELLINESGSPLMQSLIASLHKKAAALVAANALSVPAASASSVIKPMSGGK